MDLSRISRMPSSHVTPYKKLRNEFTGVLTGKGINWSGSRIREEATGYGPVYFVEEMLRTKANTISGKVVTISGSGNVAQFAAEKAMTMGGKVVTLSDSNGFVHDAQGVDAERLAFVKELKNIKRGRIQEYAKQFKFEYFENQRR
jgi:glutamate dehydrogenase (NADP+)